MRELRARQAEVTDFVLDDLALRARKAREFAGCPERLVLLEQREVLAELGIELDDRRLVGVVRLAQLRRIHDGM
jgi:hypothetical protein